MSASLTAAYFPKNSLRSESLKLGAKLKDYRFTQLTEQTTTNLEDFKKELRSVRDHGFARDDREAYDHFLGISAPIYHDLSERIVAQSIWPSHPRHSIDDLMGWSDELKSLTVQITEMIGGIDPDLADEATLSDVF